MERFLAWSFVLMAVGLIGYMIKQAASGKRSLLCVRNFFLLGVIIFQVAGAATMYIADHYGEIPPSDPNGTGLKYLGIISLFLAIFVVVYETGWLTRSIRNRIRTQTPVPGTPALFIIALACLGAAAVCQLILKNLGLVGVLSEVMGVGLAAMAAGTAGWAWAGQPRNIAIAVFFVCVFGCAAALTLFEEFGRRSVVGVILAAMWGLYYGGFKYFNFRRAAIPMAVIGAGGLVLVAAVTSTRGLEDGKSRGLSEMVRRLNQADIEDGFLQLLSGQDAASNSMWVMENRPEPYPYEPLGSLIYFTVNGVPRQVWPNKPISLGMTMVAQSMVAGKGEGYTVGPGLVGHIANDNPWMALPLYAVLFGAWLRIVDDLIRRYPLQPLVVMPLGVALGEILGLARGELGFFMFRATVGMVTSFLLAVGIARLMRLSGSSHGAGAGAEPSLPAEDAEPDPAAAYDM
jgi:hypothetical protein